MEHIKTVYLGNLKSRSIHLSSGKKITTTAGQGCSESGENFSPTDLMCASLSSCMLTVMDEAAMEKGFTIKGTEARMSKVMATGPPRVGEILIEFIFPAEKYTEKQKRVLERTAMMGPVALSLHPQIMLMVSFIYPDSKKEVVSF